MATKNQVRIIHYTFTPGVAGVGTIKFDDYEKIYLDGILLVVNVTSGKNEIIYLFYDKLLGGSVALNVLTLNCDTSGMSPDDDLTIYYDSTNAGRYHTTSTTELTIALSEEIGEGIIIEVDRGLAWEAGDRAKIKCLAVSYETYWMKGLVLDYQDDKLTVYIDTINGEGTFSSWDISYTYRIDLKPIQVAIDSIDGKVATAAKQEAIGVVATAANQVTLLAELEKKADLAETQPISAASLPLPDGAATENTLLILDGKITACDTTNLATNNKVDQLIGELATDVATQTTLAAMNTKIPASPATEDGNLATIAGDTANLDTSLLGVRTDLLGELILHQAVLIAIQAKTDNLDTALSGLGADLKTIAEKTIDTSALATFIKQDTLLAELEKKADLTETQPISAASLPLPYGAAKQARLYKIFSSSADTPIRITTQGEFPHGFTFDDMVIISNHEVNTAANGLWRIEVVGEDTFDLIDSVGIAAGGATGIVSSADKDFVAQTTLTLIQAKTDNLNVKLSDIKTGTDKIIAAPATAAKQEAIGVVATAANQVTLLAELEKKADLTETQPIAGTVTANAGTNLNTSELAKEAGGKLASIDTKITACNTTDLATNSKVDQLIGELATDVATETTMQDVLGKLVEIQIATDNITRGDTTRWSFSDDYLEAQGGGIEIQPAPGEGFALYVTDVVFSNGDKVGKMALLAAISIIFLGMNDHINMHFITPRKLQENIPLVFCSEDVTTHSIVVNGFIGVA